MPLLIINGIIPSSISQLYRANDKNRIQIILQTAALITAGPTILVAIIFAYASSEILSLIFGASYSAASNVLLILIIGQVISTLVGSPGTLLAMADRQKALMFIGICSGLVGILISLLLVGSYGIVGIATGASLGKIIHNLTIWFYCLRVLKIKTHASVFHMKYIKDIINFKNTK
jgi:O-antigen/teichoic acid export membrane protein